MDFGIRIKGETKLGICEILLKYICGIKYQWNIIENNGGDMARPQGMTNTPVDVFDIIEKLIYFDKKGRAS